MTRVELIGLGISKDFEELPVGKVLNFEITGIVSGNLTAAHVYYRGELKDIVPLSGQHFILHNGDTLKVILNEAYLTNYRVS